MSTYELMKISPIVLVGILAFLPKVTFAQPDLKNSNKGWAQAEAKMTAHLKSIDPKMHSVEIKSERFKTYLSGFRVFVRFDLKKENQSGLVLVNQSAEITDLGEENWHGDAAAPCLRVPRLTEFVRARKIQVKTEQDAIEFTKFFEELQGALDQVASLRANSKDMAAPAKPMLQLEPPSEDWKYTSVKRAAGWKVMAQYVGDPVVSIMKPPTYELDIDAQGAFRDLRRYESSSK